MSAPKPIIKSMLDCDLYKWTMCQAVCQLYPHALAKYKFINRGGTQFPKGFIERLKEQVIMMEDLQLYEFEANWLRKTCSFFTPVFIDFMTGYRYNSKEVDISLDQSNNLAITIKGPWYRTILWEVKLMALISELYFQMIATKDYSEIRGPAIIKAQLKANKLCDNNITYADFGTRRRFSYQHQNNIVDVSHMTAPDNFIGTSNMYLAMTHNIKSTSTQAHEWFMFHGAKNGYKEANHTALRSWVDVYHGNFGIALSDTFTTNVFFQSFGSKYAKLFDGVRHDSGNPLKFTDSVIHHYQSLGIDPKTKTIVFSDGLNIEEAIKIKNWCNNRIKCSFGIGTNLSNDIEGVKPLNMVIKMSECKPYGESEWLPVVKLSDTIGKHTGTEREIKLCKESLRIL